MAHARLANGKILKTGFGCIEELLFNLHLFGVVETASAWVMLRQAALLGRHMTGSQETVLWESQSRQHVLRQLASIWQLSGHSDLMPWFTQSETGKSKVKGNSFISTLFL